MDLFQNPIKQMVPAPAAVRPENAGGWFDGIPDDDNAAAHTIWRSPLISTENHIFITVQPR